MGVCLKRKKHVTSKVTKYPNRDAQHHTPQIHLFMSLTKSFFRTHCKAIEREKSHLSQVQASPQGPPSLHTYTHAHTHTFSCLQGGSEFLKANSTVSVPALDSTFEERKRFTGPYTFPLALVLPLPTPPTAPPLPSQLIFNCARGPSPTHRDGGVLSCLGDGEQPPPGEMPQRQPYPTGLP